MSARNLSKMAKVETMETVPKHRATAEGQTVTLKWYYVRYRPISALTGM